NRKIHSYNALRCNYHPVHCQTFNAQQRPAKYGAFSHTYSPDTHQLLLISAKIGIKVVLLPTKSLKKPWSCRHIT
ncbi:hypothetical protein, partial [Salmonella enterica]|uniref:hypothetical protein n=1 Tax=Salmonella enterica TaxID=28901 RepID=UPI003CE83A87